MVESFRHLRCAALTVGSAPSPRQAGPDAAPGAKVSPGRTAMPSRRVTIAEIAASAGVSVPTVSKVLNGRADVAEATRRRGQQVMVDRGCQRPASPAPRPLGLIDMV